MKTCEMLKFKSGYECGEPADFKVTCEDIVNYFCKNCYRAGKQAAIQLGLPKSKGTVVERIK